MPYSRCPISDFSDADVRETCQSCPGRGNNDGQGLQDGIQIVLLCDLTPVFRTAMWGEQSDEMNNDVNDDNDDDGGDPKVLSPRKNGASYGGRAAETAMKKNGTAAKAPTIKITSVVMDRSLKPVLGLFFEQAGSKAYRHACDKYSRCPWTRNCGPAFVLRLAVHETISDAVLDQPLVRTEDR